MAGAQNYRDQQPGLEVVQARSGESAPELALPDHTWLYPVHDANEQQKVLPGSVLLQQRHLQSAQEQQYSQDYNLKYQSLRGKYFLTTPEVVPCSATGSATASDYGGYQTPPKEASIVQPPRRRSRRKLIILAAVVVLVLVGAIVGGVVGVLKSRQNSSNNSSSASPNETPPAAPYPDSQAAMSGGPGSPTSVAPGFAPTAISRGYPHMEVFALSNDKMSSIYRKYRNSNATSAKDFLPHGLEMELVGGGVDRDKTPTISVSWRHHVEKGVLSNRTEMHIPGVFDSRVFRKYRDQDGAAGWSPASPDNWDWFGGPTWSSSPTQVRYGPEASLMGAFYLCRAPSGLGICFWGWTPESSWSLVSNPVAGKSDLQHWAAPAAVAWNGDDTRLDVFAVSRVNNHLVHTWRDVANSSSSSPGAFAPYEDLKGFVTTPPVVVARAPGFLDVFARGGDGGLWHLGFQNGNWSEWELLSGPGFQIQGQPEAVSTSADTIDVFAWGVKGELLHKKFNSGTEPKWTPPASSNGGFDVVLDNGLSGPPRAVTDGTGDIHILAYDENNNILLSTLSSKPGVTTDKTLIAAVPMSS